MQKIAICLLFSLQILSQSALAAYDDDLTHAIRNNEFDRVTELLDHPPQGIAKPLATSAESAGVLLSVYLVLRKQTDPVAFAETATWVRQMIGLGADPGQDVPYEEAPAGTLLSSATELILNDWVQAEQNPNHPGPALAIKAAKEMFDIFFATKAIDPNVQVKVFFSQTEFRRMGIVHSLLIRQASPSLRRYFLAQGVRQDSLDDAQHNSAMIAAGSGMLDGLRDILEVCGRHEAAAMFNYKCPIRFNPTVLHMALMQLAHGAKAADVIPVVEFLVIHGANPEQRSMYHDLIDELNFWQPQRPQYRAEYEKMRAYFLANESRLQGMYSACSVALRANATKN